MANGDGVQPWEYSGTGSLYRDDFARMGHPGKFHKSILVSSGTTTNFTGSNFGAGGIIISGSATGTIELSGGGVILIESLVASTPQIYELSIAKVTVTAQQVYVLIRNPIVR